MNWITVAVVGAVAAWFEYSYRRSRRKKAESGGTESSTVPVTQPARVAKPGNEPSIVPGDENDKQMNAAM
jgi:hypothetical protein